MGNFVSSTVGTYDIMFLISSPSLSKLIITPSVLLFILCLHCSCDNTVHRNTAQIVMFCERLCYKLHSLFITPHWNALWTKLKLETLSQITIRVRRRISCVYVSNNLPLADLHSRSYMKQIICSALWFTFLNSFFFRIKH